MHDCAELYAVVEVFVLEEIVALDRVTLDGLLFIGSKRRGLVKDRLRDHHLSDIVVETALDQYLDVLVAEAEPLTLNGADQRDIQRMRIGDVVVLAEAVEQVEYLDARTAGSAQVCGGCRKSFGVGDSLALEHLFEFVFHYGDGIVE